MGILDNLFGGGAEKDAANKNRALLGQYQNNAFGALDTGLANSKAALDKAYASYDPLASLGTKYGAASTLALDALGANGADGTARARTAFQTAPGYEFQRDQALEAVNRRRALSGMWDSGNTDHDLLKTATGLADQSYNSWLSNLQSYVNPELSATSGAATGRAASLGSLANLYSQDAQNRANVFGSVTSGGMAANNAEAAGAAAGAKNALSAGLSLASLAAGIPGGGAGFNFGGSATPGAYMMGGTPVTMFR